MVPPVEILPIHLTSYTSPKTATWQPTAKVHPHTHKDYCAPYPHDTLPLSTTLKYIQPYQILPPYPRTLPEYPRFGLGLRAYTHTHTHTITPGAIAERMD